MSDTLDSLQTALAPKTGMRRIPFALESYQHPSPPLSAKRLLNFFAESAPADARATAALLSTPGLATRLTVGDGPIWAINNDFAGFWYIVSGTRFYRFTSDTDGDHVVDLGEIGAPSISGRFDYLDMITVAVGNAAAVVCVPPDAYICSHTDTSVNLMGGTFPGRATSVAILDDYFVFTSADFGFFISLLNDPSDFDALDFASNPGGGDVRVMVVNGELWFGSPGGMQIWYDAGSSGLEITPGTSFFPFRPQRGARIAQGVGSPQSMAIGDSSLFWLGIDGIVYRSNGYRAVRISTHGVETITQARGTLLESAFCTTHRGHVFYVMNYPALTLVYDCATQKWHDRASSIDGTGRWRGNASAAIEIDTSLVGDRLSGQLFYGIEGLGTEAGVRIMRQATMPPIWGGTNRAFMSRLELEMETGNPIAPGSVIIEWSDDGGFNWNGGPRTMQTGSTFNRRFRAFTTRLGSFRQRVFRFTVSGHCTLYAVDADIASPGTQGA